MNNIQSVGTVAQYKPQFKAENNTLSPQMRQPISQDQLMLKMMQEQKKKEKNQKLKQNLSWGIGIAASALFAIWIGRGMWGEHAAKKVGNKILERIEKCSDPVLKEAARNEYAKGPHMMSQKRLKDILTLAELKDVKPGEVDIKAALDKIDEKIVGMDEVKEQLLDYLIHYNYCIKKGIPNKKPLVISLDGPAGTGKTTISEVLAEALGMHYKKISLAGATGKAPIKGYEAVYTGASMGGIAEGQIEGKTRRVLYCLDEVEKSGTSDHNGKIEDTLLALFDDQGKFMDDNLNVPIDVSQSIFVLTSNEFEKLSGPLKNRIKNKIKINPYGKEIKAQIAELKFMEELKRNKLTDKVNIPEDKKVFNVLAEFTDDQGGRQATANAQSLIDKIITNIELGEAKGKIDITEEYARKMLGENKKPIRKRVEEAIAENRYGTPSDPDTSLNA